jgi:RimJ/RimL family protein N-acetyltransferase
MSVIIVTTDRLILRRWRDSDREAFARMNSDSRVMEFFPAVLSREESDALVDRAEAHFRGHGFGPCAAELRGDGAFIGFIGLSIPAFEAHFTPCVEVGWRLAVDYWGRGLATEGARAAVRYGFETLGFEEIVSFTVPANVRSRRVMEKLGMTRNPADDFDHPRLPERHQLRRHVLYRLRGADWEYATTTDRLILAHIKKSPRV